MPRQFKGVIDLDIRKSKGDWDALLAQRAPKDAPNSRVLKLPLGAPLMLFAIGRTVGWIGHAIEQYETGQLIRPRARDVGPPAAIS